MIARLLICSDGEKIRKEIQKNLAFHLKSGNINHPDLLYIKAGEKLGIAEARKVKEHFSLKPYSAKGKMAVLEDISVMTVEAQNALLKTLEELAGEAIFILGTNSDANILPTILSRCEIANLESKENTPYTNNYEQDIKKLLSSTIQDRFGYIEKLKEKQEFLQALNHYFHELIIQNATNNITDMKVNAFLKELLQAEQWAKQNVNIRAILEYLMLVMPSKIC